MTVYAKPGPEFESSIQKLCIFSLDANTFLILRSRMGHEIISMRRRERTAQSGVAQQEDPCTEDFAGPRQPLR